MNTKTPFNFVAGTHYLTCGQWGYHPSEKVTVEHVFDDGSMVGKIPSGKRGLWDKFGIGPFAWYNIDREWKPTDEIPEKPETTLLPCPFCGSEAVLRKNEEGNAPTTFRAECSNVICPIGPHTFRCTSEDQVREHWNRREGKHQ